jgi:hypothetical protein
MGVDGSSRNLVLQGHHQLLQQQQSQQVGTNMSIFKRPSKTPCIPNISLNAANDRVASPLPGSRILTKSLRRASGGRSQICSR